MSGTSSPPPSPASRPVQEPDRRATAVLRLIIAGALLGLVGTTAMALAHSGLALPLADRLGPTRLILPALAGFSIGAVLYAVLLVGGLRRRRWALPVGVAVHAMAAVTALTPLRGWFSVAAIVVGTSSIAILLTPAARRALRPWAGEGSRTAAPGHG